MEKNLTKTILPVAQIFANIYSYTQPEGVENQFSDLSLAKDLCLALACIANETSHWYEVGVFC